VGPGCARPAGRAGPYQYFGAGRPPGLAGQRRDRRRPAQGNLLL